MGSVIYEVLHTIVPPVAKTVWRPDVRGLDNIPPTGGVILASNHLSFADSVMIPIVVPRKVVFLAKSDYFTRPGLGGAAQRAWFQGLGMLPVDRDDTRAALGSLDTALEVLGRGEAFGIYPEGTRSRDGRLYRGRTGVARLSVAAGVPIVPVGMLGTDKVQPIGQPYPKPFRGKVTVRFGKPIETTGRADDRTSLRALTDEVMAEIQKLTGQEYVPRYAPAKTAPPPDA